MATFGPKHELERRVSALIAKQHGVISRTQARELGLSHAQVQVRLGGGAWEILLPGVLHPTVAPLTWFSRLTAACLWGGADAAISHRAAAAFWKLDGFSEELVEMTTSRPLRPSLEVVVHRATYLPRAHTTVIGPIRVTTVHRTLVDLGAVSPADLVEKALESALNRRITTEARLKRYLDELRTKGRKGAAILNSLLLVRGQGTAPTESPLETETIQVLRKNGLPDPVRQLVVKDRDGHIARVDLVYPDEKIVIEVDSRSHHLRRQQWESDLARRNELTSRGWLVLHATKRKLRDDMDAFISCIKRTRAERGKADPTFAPKRRH
jgi:very-short-patch-repair endonuclease